MRLLLIDAHDDEQIDQILVVVPDEYDQKEVLAEAKDMIGGNPIIEVDVEIGDEANHKFSTYRMYVG